jgi:hypothetical protein
MAVAQDRGPEDDDELMRWEHAPDATWDHPTNDHFLPLFTALGAMWHRATFGLIMLKLLAMKGNKR